jgi:hypothetical protein
MPPPPSAPAELPVMRLWPMVTVAAAALFDRLLRITARFPRSPAVS